MPDMPEPRHWGTGEAAVLAHCTLAHGGEWSGLARELPGYRLIAPDMPGHGRSAPWQAEQGDLHDLATARLRRVAAAEGAPVRLVGHSFGGVVALRLALENPELLQSLVLIEPVLFAAVREDGRDSGNGAFEAAWATGDREASARAFTGVWGADADWDSMPQRQRDYILERIHLVAAQNPTIRHDRPGLLRPGRIAGLDLPVLLVYGGDSPPVAGEVIEYLATRLPRAQVFRMPGAGHMLPVSHPAELARAIGDFWAGEG